jgi:parvulin-like peptidyl-prolyl isomerase
MKLVVLLLLAAFALPAWQLPAPDKVLAHVNDDAITTAKLSELLAGAPPLAVNSAGTDPTEFLTWTYLLNKMSSEGDKLGLAKKSPYSDRLSWSRAQALMMARIEEKSRETMPDSGEMQTIYRENPHRYGTAKTKLIFIPAGPGARAKMDMVAAQAAAKGADFVKLVKLYSADEDSVAKDGDFADIKNDSKIPEAIRKAIFLTKPGAVTQVFSQPAGFYLFKVTAIEMKPFEEISQESGNLTGQQRASEWMAEEKKRAVVKIIHEDFFKNLKVTAGPMVSRGAQEINLQATPQTAEIKPTTLLAELNGKPMTAEDYTNLIKSLSPQIRTKAIVAPTDFLKDYAFMLMLADDGQKQGLDQKQPYRNRLKYDRDMTLMQGAVDDYLNNIVITVDEQKAGYAADPNRFRFATSRVLYIAYSLSPPPQSDPNAKKVLNEQEAQQKIEGILKEISGKKDDFTAYVSKYSEDEFSRNEGGIMRPVSFTDPQVPENIKQAIFGAKPGDVVGPVKLPNGFYLFKVDTIEVRKYEEVKDQIYEQLRDQRFQDWFTQQRVAFKVKVDDPEGFRAVVAKAAAGK